MQKMIFLLFLGCAVLNAQPIGECNNFLIIQKLKDILKDKIVKNFYDSINLKEILEGFEVNESEYLEFIDDMKEYIEIDSISSFEKFDENTCKAIVNVKIRIDEGKYEKGSIEIVYKFLDSDKIKITNMKEN
ncbi:hypothetical protein [Campylobacter sp. 2457A]|uniref:hypothetical protein n=1 Tax=Campylobacter sp. 2457A TaxID=2735784 RepID=UPI00301BBCCF|nr:hypothetical protein [Campylobacter sp. 2457A]